MENNKYKNIAIVILTIMLVSLFFYKKDNVKYITKQIVLKELNDTTRYVNDINSLKNKILILNDSNKLYIKKYNNILLTYKNTPDSLKTINECNTVINIQDTLINNQIVLLNEKDTLINKQNSYINTLQVNINLQKDNTDTLINVNNILINQNNKLNNDNIILERKVLNRNRLTPVISIISLSVGFVLGKVI